MAENGFLPSGARTPLRDMSLMETSMRTEYYRDETPRKILQTKYAESYSTRGFKRTDFDSLVCEGNENSFSPVSSKSVPACNSPQRLVKLFTPKKLDLLGNKQSTPIRHYSNPFETGLTDRLHAHSFSPSVFSKVLSPSQEEDSNWRIEQVALLNPADFHLSPQLFSYRSDPLVEAEAQEAILKYFNQPHIAPSPWSDPKTKTSQTSKLNRSNSQPSSMRPAKSKPSVKNAWTQTMLSLPPDLPAEVEEVLSRYLNQGKEEVGQSPVSDAGDVSLNSSGLRRKLFLASDKSISASPPSGTPSANSESPASVALSSSPINISAKSLTLSPPLPYTRTLASPQLSPISSNCIQNLVFETDLNQSMTCSCAEEDEGDAPNEQADVRERTLLMEEETAQSWVNLQHEGQSFLEDLKMGRQAYMETCDTGYYSSSSSITQSRTAFDDLPHAPAQIKFEKSQFFSMDA